MRVELTNQVALVTGGAHRVGRAIALELARRGAHIMLHYYRSPDDTVRETLQAIKSFGVKAFQVQADIGTVEGVEAVFAALRESFGRLNILVNNASIFQRRQLLEVTPEDWHATMNINLFGPFLCTQQAAALMQATPSENVEDPTTHPRPGGVIINICDRGALEPWPEFAHHGISKAGLLALTKVSAASLGPEIRVNAIIPGPVLKPEDTSDEKWAKSGARVPLKRTGTAEDVARAVAYLAMEDYITGAVLHVDGGSSVV
ncbi:MAG: SDR family oxidoreductase [Chloroflexi bacterium]|nr:SDR family oxidoreductase [Chloroflexota bacterium]